MFFAIAGIIIAVSCTAISAKVLLGYNNFNRWVKFGGTLLILVSWFAPFILNIIKHLNYFSDHALAIFSNFMYYLFGLAFVLFILIMLRDILWFLLYGILKLFKKASERLNPKNEHSLALSNLVVLVLAFFVSFYGVYEALRVPDIKNITIESTKIKKPTKIVFVSDLHITSSSSLSRLQKIVDLINAQNADAVVLGGDIIDDKISKITKDLDVLSTIKAPLGVYAIMGNHEFYRGIPSWLIKFSRLKIKTLINRGVHLGKTGVYLAGVPDKTADFVGLYRLNPKMIAKGSKKTDYLVVASHYPDMNMRGLKYDLQVSGHTHGGQIFPFSILSQKANKYLAGEYQKDGSLLWVSRGAGYWGPSMRVLAPADILVFHLNPKK